MILAGDGTIDPEWTVWRRWECGHFQMACCTPHLDKTCPKCPKPVDDRECRSFGQHVAATRHARRDCPVERM